MASGLFISSLLFSKKIQKKIAGITGIIALATGWRNFFDKKFNQKL